MTHGLDTSFLVAVEVSCHPDHSAARTLAGVLRQRGDCFALAPQALAEFVHIVTDPKRFTAPLTMPQALHRVRRVHLRPARRAGRADVVFLSPQLFPHRPWRGGMAAVARPPLRRRSAGSRPEATGFL